MPTNGTAPDRDREVDARQEPATPNPVPCILCEQTTGATRPTREDVIPDWAHRYFRLPKKLRAIIHRGMMARSDGAMVYDVKSQPAVFPEGKVLVANVCASCNNRRMSELQKGASKIFKALHEGSTPNSLHEAQLAILARWTVMTAFFWQHTQSVGGKPVPVEHARAAIHGQMAHPGTYLVLGNIRPGGTDFQGEVTQRWCVTCFNGGSIEAVGDSELCYRAAFRVGSILLAAVFIPPESELQPVLLEPLHKLVWPKRAAKQIASWHLGEAAALHSQFVAFSCGLGLCHGPWVDCYDRGLSQPDHAWSLREHYCETLAETSRLRAPDPQLVPATSQTIIVERRLPFTQITRKFKRQSDDAEGAWSEIEVTLNEAASGQLVRIYPVLHEGQPQG